MLKLYRFNGPIKQYWETWENPDGSHVVHWGVLGTKGESKSLQDTKDSKARDLIQEEINELAEQGFTTAAQTHTLMLEYNIEGQWGSKADLDKRHDLEGEMNELLGWTGLGHCDGGSIGSGTMEICNFVVDFELAKKVITDHLSDTEHGDFNRIYDGKQ